MAVQLAVPDVLPFAPSIDEAQAIQLITGTLARAAQYAPCILDASFTANEAAKDIILAGVLRRVRTAGGVVTTSTIGTCSITVDNRSLVGGLFMASEISELQSLCRASLGDIATAVPHFSMPDPPGDWQDPAQPPWISPLTS